MASITTNSSYEGDSARVIEENLLGLEKKTYAYDAFGEALSLSQKPNSQAPVNRYSYLHDPGSSVSLLVDSQGAVKESYAYTAYGSPNNAISKKAIGFSQGSVPTNPVRFQGKRFDSGSGSYDMGARRYSAQAGRWLQQDFYADALDNLGLSQDPLTANRYAFLGANPVNYVEWDGHIAIRGNLLGGLKHWTDCHNPFGGNKRGCKDPLEKFNKAMDRVDTIVENELKDGLGYSNMRKAYKEARKGNWDAAIAQASIGTVKMAAFAAGFATGGSSQVALKIGVRASAFAEKAMTSKITIAAARAAHGVTNTDRALGPWFTQTQRAWTGLARGTAAVIKNVDWSRVGRYLNKIRQNARYKNPNI